MPCRARGTRAGIEAAVGVGVAHGGRHGGREQIASVDRVVVERERASAQRRDLAARPHAGHVVVERVHDSPTDAAPIL